MNGVRGNSSVDVLVKLFSRNCEDNDSSASIMLMLLTS